MSLSNKLIIITAPSGAGKTSITKYLLKTFPDQLTFSVSAATRHRRQYEEDGVDYHFMSVEEFKERIQKNSFVEWEMVYEGKYYGTLKSEIHRIWKEGKTPLLDIDVQGAVHVRQQHPDHTLSIFIEPPSVDELKKRLNTRGTETLESLDTRLNKATYELTFKVHFDKVIINDNLEKACIEASRIVSTFLSK
ncbi:MAG TPA: guanylate kinase [Chitinophagaceae bacterium]|jgi:guanylate kinase|nr:guanylate kinase [Chitinophagaceae bacterium]